MVQVLVLYYSEGGATQALAQAVVDGVESVAGVTALLRTVPPIVDAAAGDYQQIPERGALYVSTDDIRTCAGLALGSPIHYGQMASALQHFFERNVGLWLNGALINKPATVFASGSSMHGGQEAALLSMMVPLLHHGALLLGIPYSEQLLNQTDVGGTPYGATHVNHHKTQHLAQTETALARAQGIRLATWALKSSQS